MPAQLSKKAGAGAAVAPLLLALVLAMPVGTAWGQTQAPTVTPPASVQHSLLKGITYKTGTIITNMLFLTPATGSWRQAAVLTAAFTGVAIGLYVANDYLWDKIYPAKPANPNDKFDIADSAKRTSLKFITYKTTVTLATSGILYVWTGSLPIVLTVGVGLAIAKAGVFALNDMVWNWYDWYEAKAAVP